jgi:DNA gyrase subunit B/topoisomerase-4 subunit B
MRIRLESLSAIMFTTDRIMTFSCVDCRNHGIGTGAELFIVEGESAAKAVVRARDPQFQAVLPMQGKPLNAWKANDVAVANHGLYQALIRTIGTGWQNHLEPARLRFDRIIFLCDPDADGIHCSALLLLFFYRWMQPLLAAGHVGAIGPPRRKITLLSTGQVVYTYSREHHQRVQKTLAERGVRDYQVQHFRGLASMDGQTISTVCLNPATRNYQPLQTTDAQNTLALLETSPL